MRYGWLLACAACNGEPKEPSLTLQGPAEVRVEKLGPVDGPRALRADGTEPTGIVWTVSDSAVATVRDGTVIALGLLAVAARGHPAPAAGMVAGLVVKSPSAG